MQTRHKFFADDAPGLNQRLQDRVQAVIQECRALRTREAFVAQKRIVFEVRTIKSDLIAKLARLTVLNRARLAKIDGDFVREGYGQLKFICSALAMHAFNEVAGILIFYRGACYVIHVHIMTAW